MATGRPIITTDVVGCKDAIIPGYTGLICKPKSSKSLEAKLKLLIMNKKKRQKFGYNGRKLAEKEFDWNFIVNDWVRQINNITDGKEPNIKNLDLHSPD